MFSTILNGVFGQDSPGDKDISHRPAMFAGSFYPKEPAVLQNLINEYLKSEESVIEDDVAGVIAPHAGYVYSGATAGKAYRHLVGKSLDAIIIIAPSHQKYFKGASVFNGDAYVTPLGVCKCDKELCSEIASVNSDVYLSLDGHNWRDSSAEHSLEVQLPFLQTVQPNVPIVPIIMGTQNSGAINSLMQAVVKAVKKLNRKVCIVASSDLSHYHSMKEAKIIDKQVYDAFSSFDYFRFSLLHQSKNIEACGAGPIIVTMMACEQLGANKSFPVEYKTSGDTEAGKYHSDRVVGYFSSILAINKNEPESTLPIMTEDEKSLLLKVTENSVKKKIMGNKFSDTFDIKIPEVFTKKFTGFVTLTKKGELRACMGHTIPMENMYNEITYMAQVAATSDYRFGAVTQDELSDIKYEISILSRFKRVLDFNEIKVSRDGLYIKMGSQTGLLLPQVASERKWDTKTFLEQTCNKAGLPKNSYLNDTAEIYKFEALIIN